MKTIFHFVKSNNLSGLENVVINICTLVKNYNYTYVSTKGPIDKYLKHYGIKHITISRLTPLNMFKVIKKYNPDIVQAHDARASVFLAPSYFYCKIHHIKMISELHNDDPKMSELWRLRSLTYGIASMVFNNIIIVSKDILNNYAYKWIINKNKVTIIKNVINPIRVKKGLVSNGYKKWDCMFLGRFTYQKDPFRFINIINKLKSIKPDIKAVMVGTGNLLFKSKQLVNSLHLNKNIIFVGFQHNPYRYLEDSKLLLITSRFEGIPLVVLEALMVGLPVISTPIEGLIGIINDYCGGFANTNNEFVNKIYSLLINKKKYNQFSCNALNHIHKINNVKRFVASYNNIYKY